jgi:hypothetical protein
MLCERYATALSTVGIGDWLRMCTYPATRLECMLATSTTRFSGISASTSRLTCSVSDPKLMTITMGISPLSTLENEVVNVKQYHVTDDKDSP